MHKRNRQLPLIISGLMAVSLASVGFSSWIIAGKTSSAEVGNVNVQVGELIDKSLSISAIEITSGNSIQFDDDGHNGSEIKVPDTNKNREVLSSVINLTIKSDSSLPLHNGKGSNINTSAISGIKVAFTSSDNATLNKCISGGIIQTPFTPGAEAEVFKFSDTSKTDTRYYTNPTGNTKMRAGYELVPQIDTSTLICKFSVHFTWGSVFNYQNPTRGSAATLNENYALLSSLKNLTFTYTFTPIPGVSK